ncbi:MAG: tRNA (N(6)-L-threonylcarbamoyladenosine(37)-C(2))-methylthiotransferase MtaB [Pseudomonadota bacterium]
MNTRTRQPRHVISMGCRLNLAEGAQIERGLTEADADNFFVVNTCGVTNEAVRQSRQNIRRVRRENPGAKIIATGCAAQIDPEMFASMEEVDAVVGNNQKLSPSTWRDLKASPPENPAFSSTTVMRIDDIMSVRDTAPHLTAGYGDRSRAFLQVQNGCDHRCTFCAIPYGRGNARSAQIGDVVEQANRLTEEGHQELVVTGVDITSWGNDLEGNPHLGALVSAILDQTPRLRRLRLSSIDGAEMDDELLARVVGDERVAPHIHLSVQAGDDMILKRMKRRHSRQDIIELTTKIRSERPDVAFGADIIAGFPTETEEMFENSRTLVSDAGLNFLHVFPFSPRKGTPAARMPQLEASIIKRRSKALRETGREATQSFLSGLVGSLQEATIESGGIARLGNFAEAILDTPFPEYVGQIKTIFVHGRKDMKLLASMHHPTTIAAE